MQNQIQSMKGKGEPLPRSARDFFQPRFNKDFSQVRIHTGSRAAEAARPINAKAFTFGRDIVFGAGQYSPNTTIGKRLLAHELTHVAQQTSNEILQRKPGDDDDFIRAPDLDTRGPYWEKIMKYRPSFPPKREYKITIPPPPIPATPKAPTTCPNEVDKRKGIKDNAVLYNTERKMRNAINLERSRAAVNKTYTLTNAMIKKADKAIKKEFGSILPKRTSFASPKTVSKRTPEAFAKYRIATDEDALKKIGKVALKANPDVLRQLCITTPTDPILRSEVANPLLSRKKIGFVRTYELSHIGGETAHNILKSGKTKHHVTVPTKHRYMGHILVHEAMHYYVHNTYLLTADKHQLEDQLTEGGAEFLARRVIHNRLSKDPAFKINYDTYASQFSYVLNHLAARSFPLAYFQGYVDLLGLIPKKMPTTTHKLGMQVITNPDGSLEIEVVKPWRSSKPTVGTYLGLAKAAGIAPKALMKELLTSGAYSSARQVRNSFTLGTRIIVKDGKIIYISVKGRVYKKSGKLVKDTVYLLGDATKIHSRDYHDAIVERYRKWTRLYDKTLFQTLDLLPFPVKLEKKFLAKLKADYKKDVKIKDETILKLLPPLNTKQKKWILYGIVVLMGKTLIKPIDFDIRKAVLLLIARSRYRKPSPRLKGSHYFIYSVLRASRVLKYPGRQSKGGKSLLSKLRRIYTPKTKRAKTRKRKCSEFKVNQFKTILGKALKDLFIKYGPTGRMYYGQKNIPVLKNISDIVQEEARSYFAPYADTASGNIYTSGSKWTYSSKLRKASSIPMSEVRRLRPHILKNRALLVGRISLKKLRKFTSVPFTKGTIFSNVRFQHKCSKHGKELDKLITHLLNKAAFVPIVDWHIKNTGRLNREKNEVFIRGGIYSSATSRPPYPSREKALCEVRWQTLSTLSHELLHLMKHTGFEDIHDIVEKKQILYEGFTEVLGTQLYNKRLRVKALSDSRFKAKMERGLPGAPCKDIPEEKIGYGQAGKNAEKIRKMIGDDNFRAAYFWGKTKFVGL